jgi:DNA-binding NarL/FixJ family response regulator
MAPRALKKAIKDAHEKQFNPTEARVLAFLAQGYTNEEIACLMEVTASTVRRHIADMCHRVFERTEVAQERDKLKAWIRPHRKCCIPLVREMIENDRKIA